MKMSWGTKGLLFAIILIVSVSCTAKQGRCLQLYGRLSCPENIE